MSVVALLWSSLCFAENSINIAILEDGPNPRIKGQVEAIQQAVQDLTGGEFQVEFPEKYRLNANWDVSRIPRIIDEVFQDAEVDIVLTLGPVVSHSLATRSRIEKPSIVISVIDADLQGFPLAQNSSGVKNLNYLATFSNAERDVARFLELHEFKRLIVLVDPYYLSGIPQLSEKAPEIAEDMGLVLQVVEAEDDPRQVLNSIPSDAEAVYITPLLRFSEPGFRELVEELNARKLPTFSLIGPQEVKQGVLASAAPSSDIERIARRVALHVQRVLLGDDPGDLKVSFSEGERLTINMKTAYQVGVVPNWRTMTTADLINPEPEKGERHYTIKETMEQAIDANLSLRSSELNVEIGNQQVALARSGLLPQIDSSVQSVQVDKERVENSFGQLAERTSTGSLTASQLIYSDGIWANYDAQKSLQIGRQYNHEDTQLGIALEAALAYIQLLQAKRLETIAKENATVTRSNLELARVRQRIGSARPAEVYRWESELASDRSDLISAQTQVNQARVLLNRVLHRPLEEYFSLEPISIDDPSLVTSVPEVYSFTSNPLVYAVFRDFMVAEAMDTSPALKEIDAAIAAQKRLLVAARRSFWVPDISLDGSISKPLEESGLGAEEIADDRQWQLALTARLPLFSGGAKNAELRRSRYELDRLKIEREVLAERIGETIRSGLHEVGSSFADIRLTLEAAEAAAKNLDVVIDAYSRGAATILDLLDAQNAALAADQRAAVAEFEFLADLIRVQRNVGSFDYLKSQQERQDWLQRLRDFFEQRGVEPVTQTEGNQS